MATSKTIFCGTIAALAWLAWIALGGLGQGVDWSSDVDASDGHIFRGSRP